MPFVIKHNSGFYYRQNDKSERMIDCFNTTLAEYATPFETMEKAQEFIKENLYEFTPSFLCTTVLRDYREDLRQYLNNLGSPQINVVASTYLFAFADWLQRNDIQEPQWKKSCTDCGFPCDNGWLYCPKCKADVL